MSHPLTRTRILLVISMFGLLAFNRDLKAQTLATAVDNTNLVWTTGGSNNIGWFAQSNTGAFDGVDQAVSGAIGNSQATWIQTTVTGPGTLSFWWRVFSEPDADFLSFYIDVYDAPGNAIDAI